jgi:hypothetical protein
MGVGGVGSGGAIGIAGKKSRVPLCTLQALAKDVLESGVVTHARLSHIGLCADCGRAPVCVAGVVFEEGVTVLTTLDDAMAWILRARNAMERSSTVSIQVFKCVGLGCLQTSLDACYLLLLLTFPRC